MPKSMLFILLLPYLFGGCKKSLGSSKAITDAETPKEKCRMNPGWLAIQMPESGFVSLDPDEDHECGDLSAGNWERYAGKSRDLMLVLDGPSGSGRYWFAALGVVDKKESAPVRGICFQTSTIGWRSLQAFEKGGLPWAEDLDNDGDPELIIWDSFLLSDDEDTSLSSNTGLMAWVYRTSDGEKFEIDWKMSRKFAVRIAKEYRKPQPDAFLKLIREKAARALEIFAKEGCNSEVESR